MKERDKGCKRFIDHTMIQTVCVDIAFQAVMMYQNGASVQEVRASIDKQYEQGSVKPTATPMPTM
ncbi:PCYCGC domain-containing protein [Ectobacillus funiculus]